MYAVSHTCLFMDFVVGINGKITRELIMEMIDKDVFIYLL